MKKTENYYLKKLKHLLYSKEEFENACLVKVAEKISDAMKNNYEELSATELHIKWLDGTIQEGINLDANFQNTEQGMRLLDEKNIMLDRKDFIQRQISGL